MTEYKIDDIMFEGYFRGHKTVSIQDGKGYTFKWEYRDNGESIIIDDDKHNIRPCKKCGKTFGFNDPDICLGTLPGVTFACCGNGIKEESYILFDNGLRISNFVITAPQNDWFIA